MEQKNLMISVIIPVYNAEKYLNQTIDSILDQKYQNFELLLIDDSSTDQSFDIAASYASNHPNIHVIKNKSKGISSARNEGLKHAQGAYIMFVDADDYLPDNRIFHHYISNILASNADIVVGNYARLWNGNLLPATSHDEISKFAPESEAFRFHGFFSVGTLSYVWGKLYKKDFLKQHHICFMDLSYAEDKLFNMQCYICDANYAFISDRVYIYRKNDQSVSYQYHKDSVKCWLKFCKLLKKWILKQEKDLSTYGGLIDYTIFFASFFDAKMEYEQHQKSLRYVVDILKQYHQDPLGKRCFDQLAKGKFVSSIQNTMWRIMIGCFSFGMKYHFYFPLAIGMKLLIDLRVDERLSDTGLREKSVITKPTRSTIKKQPLISVIVPVYMIEAYISQCIDSILAQTYPNLEIILVDDGTRDRSGVICDDYAKDHENIFVIHKENGGLSSARNAGLDHAHGEYIFFLDGDDFIHPDTILKLYQSLILHDSDLAICGIQYVDEDGTFLSDQDSCREYSAPDGVWTQKDFWNSYKHYGKVYCVVAWNKLYKREIFENLRFKEGKIREDEFAIHHIISNCDKISCLHEKLCYYRQQAESIMSNKYSIKQLDAAEAYMDRIMFYQKRKDQKRVDDTILDLIAFLEWFDYGMDPTDQNTLKRYLKEKKRFCHWLKKYDCQIKSPICKGTTFLYLHGLFPYRFLKDMWWKFDRMKRKLFNKTDS